MQEQTVRQARIAALREAIGGPLGTIQRREAIETLRELELTEEIDQRNATGRPDVAEAIEQHTAAERIRARREARAAVTGDPLVTLQEHTAAAIAAGAEVITEQRNPLEEHGASVAAAAPRCPVCGGLDPGNITHTRC